MADIAPPPTLNFRVFQSFFYWNCLGGRLLLPKPYKKRLCFNPSFTGIDLVAICSAMGTYSTLASFNPSFTGIALVANQKYIP